MKDGIETSDADNDRHSNHKNSQGILNQRVLVIPHDHLTVTEYQKEYHNHRQQDAIGNLRNLNGRNGLKSE